MKKTLSLAALFAVPFSLFAETLNWSIGYFEKEGGEPEKYFSATVPGAAQLDTAKAENYPRLDHSDNFKLCRWMEDVFFVYKTSFKRKALKENERLYFVSKGIDYQFDIFFNGRKILSQEGMFTPVNADLTDLQADENELKIVVYPRAESERAQGRIRRRRHVPLASREMRQAACGLRLGLESAFHNLRNLGRNLSRNPQRRAHRRRPSFERTQRQTRRGQIVA